MEGSGDAFTNPIPHLHQAIGNLKAWLNGTHRGVTRRHLAVYLDEFVFRHNRRLNLAAAFQTLLGLGTGRGPTTYDTIIGAKDLPKVAFTPSKKVARAASPSVAAAGDTSEALRASSEQGASGKTIQQTGG